MNKPEANASVVIPARFASTRFPGKPLAMISGKPMIRHVYERAAKAKGIGKVIVATDDERILAAVEGFGGNAVMTSPKHKCGTERVAEVARKLPDCGIIVNVQGDEPMINPKAIEELIKPLIMDPSIPMSSLKTPILGESELTDPNVVKVVVDLKDFALYFSRSPVPHMRSSGTIMANGTPYFRHIGLYAYRREFLIKFARLKPTPLEFLESLEQLRALENGFKIKVPTTSYRSISVDTEEDLELIIEAFSNRNSTPG